MQLLPLSLVLASAFSSPPHRDKGKAQAMRSDAKTAMTSGDYERAEQLVREAQRLDPREDFYYTLASIAGAGGDCTAQAQHYQHYFDEIGYDGGEYVEERYSKAVKRATEEMQTCQEAQPEDVPPPPEDLLPPSADAEFEPEPEPMPEDVPSSRAWLADPLGGVLVGVGLAAAGGGTAAFVLGRRRHAAASEAGSEQGFIEEERGGRVTYAVGIGLIAIGGAAIVGGIVRYVQVARRGVNTQQARIRPSLAGLTLRW